MAIRCLGFVILLFVTGTRMLGISAQLLECKGDVGAILFECKQSIVKDGPSDPPSDSCCAALKDADIPCCCKHVPKAIESKISMEKVINVSTTCGCKIPPPGDKCGDYTIPSSLPPAVQPSAPPPKA